MVADLRARSLGFDVRYTPRDDAHLLRTPCVLVDQARVERNIERMQEAAAARGMRLRPHAKTHKSPDLALPADRARRGRHLLRQARRGGGLRRPGIEDIRLPYPLNPVNADRVLALLDRTHLSFIVDHLDVARGWSARDAGGRA